MQKDFNFDSPLKEGRVFDLDFEEEDPYFFKEGHGGQLTSSISTSLP